MIADLYLPEWMDVVDVEPRTFVARMRSAHPGWFYIDGVDNGGSPAQNIAFQVATIAHAAIGQRRRAPDGAERAAPYIVHPVHVAALAIRWADRLGRRSWGEKDAIFAAALLHDVLEDTKLTAYDLIALNIHERIVNDVVTLTKTNDGPEDAPYFLRCAAGFTTWIVKAADLTANLMDFARECVPGARNQAAKNYAAGKRAHMLPVYENHRPDGVTLAERDYVLEHLATALRRCEEAAAA